MFKHLKTKSIYIGYNLTEFNQIRDLLDVSAIRYCYKTRNSQNQFLTPGTGTVRGRFGSTGVDWNHSYQYEIKVSALDEEKATYLIREHVKKRS